MWAWRPEYGDEHYWNSVVARFASGAGADRLYAKTRMTTSEIQLGKIKVTPGRRPLDEAKVVELVESISRSGLLQPLGVRRQYDRWWLVVGAHRLEALRRLGWTAVPCMMVESGNPLHWELADACRLPFPGGRSCP